MTVFVSPRAGAGGAEPPGRPLEPFARPAVVAAVVSRAAVGGVLAVQLRVPGGWGRAAWVPLVVGLLAGLPHGAVDHLVPGYALGPSRRRLVLVVAGYVLLAAAVLLAFRAWPGPALAVFVVASAGHFGAGETAFDDLRRGVAPRVDVLGVAGFGAAAAVLPLVAHPDAVAPVLALLVPGSSGRLPAPVAAFLLVVALVLVIGAIVARLARGRRGSAAELALLAATAALAPPLAAFGAYFGGWHSVRHVARLLAEDPANAADLGAGRLARPLGRFARSAALPTAAALATVLALWVVAGGWETFVAADLVVLAALTAPHLVVVAWLDRRETRRAG
jgi:Brp/Blh family beta-carotene 15,15'-monooxygenase